MSAGFAGFLLGASLIIAIGAQNAFVLRLGLARQHVLPVVLVCALSDAALIALGVAGLGALVEANRSLLTAVTAGGVLFLLVYGLIAFRRAWEGASMRVADGEGGTLRAALGTVLAFTFLNPHVYLDTVIVLGGLSAQYEGQDRFFYGLGAVTASFAWFFSLGYGARFLVPLFAKPRAWRVLDVAIGLVMCLIAWKLIGDLRSGF